MKLPIELIRNIIKDVSPELEQTLDLRNRELRSSNQLYRDNLHVPMDLLCHEDEALQFVREHHLAENLSCRFAQQQRCIRMAIARNRHTVLAYLCRRWRFDVHEIVVPDTAANVLHRACQERVDFCLSNKADVGRHDGRGNTALALAVWMNDFNICLKLLQHGADPQVSYHDFDGSLTPLNQLPGRARIKLLLQQYRANFH